ncbi:MAG: homoserine O-acetyltransferase [Chloroflexi bacterium]|nr:homoserine O-acetyltransferase [Chloroflexota bacterium]MCL5026144.1 homoserine O-acetyltransferase [Chloroflexota bacterium]
MSTHLNSRPGSAGITQTKYYTFASPPNEVLLDSGERLGPITLAYETYGQLNADRSNAILALHALSGDAHAAGISADDNGVSAIEMGMGGDTGPQDNVDYRRLGWWDNMIGPGKAFDTGKYFIICSNVLGGCRGSTGPSSTNPATGRPYGLSFPVVTVGDMVRAQRHLIEHLGIRRLLAVSGGSMGGQQALAWTVAYPEMVRACIPIASSARLSAQGIAFNEVGRQAIMRDPNWRGGDYYGSEPPRGGLAVARMIGHITYLSEESMHQKFGRRLRQKERFGFDFSTDFEVESYLRHQGESFTQRFDANSYLYITKAIDYFDLANGHGSLVKALSGVQARFLLMSFSSDWLYPSSQSKEIVRALKICGKDVSYCEIKSSYGHDAFLLEAAIQTDLISSFLAHTLANG